ARARYAMPLVAGTAAVLLALGAATWAQVGRWRDDETLYRYAIRVTDGNYLALNNLGVALLDQGRREEALPFLEQAVAAKPWYFDGNRNLGKTLADLRRYDEAVKAFQQAARTRPGDVDTRIALAHALESAGKAGEALQQLEAAPQAGRDTT